MKYEDQYILSARQQCRQLYPMSPALSSTSVDASISTSLTTFTVHILVMLCSLCSSLWYIKSVSILGYLIFLNLANLNLLLMRYHTR